MVIYIENQKYKLQGLVDILSILKIFFDKYVKEFKLLLKTHKLN